MKKFKLAMLGVLALTLAVGLNVRHALNDYGVKENKLHLEILAQSNSNWGGWGGYGTSLSTGPSETIEVHCVITRTTEVTINNGDSSNNGYNFGGSVSGGYGYINGTVSGGYSSGSGSNSGSSTTITTTITEEFDGIKTICKDFGVPYAACTPNNPCHF